MRLLLPPVTADRGWSSRAFVRQTGHYRRCCSAAVIRLLVVCLSGMGNTVAGGPDRACARHQRHVLKDYAAKNEQLHACAMSCVGKLKAALAAVPVSQPCTAAAVDTLYAAGHAASRQLSPVESDQRPTASLLETCTQQQVPGACMPVLAWLAAGLRGGLPPAATQQAHEMVCALLGIVSSVLPDSMVEELATQPVHSPNVLQAASRMVAQLGSVDTLCQQLAQVAAALVDTTFNRTSSNTCASQATNHGPSSINPPLQQQVALAVLWHEISMLLCGTAPIFTQDALGAALHRHSGLYKVLLEGNLLLLGVDPAGYQQTPAERNQLWQSTKRAGQAAVFLTVAIGQIVHNSWASALRPRGALEMPGIANAAKPFQPWMPLLKLMFVMLAKLQWHARKCTSHTASLDFKARWPAKALLAAVKQLCSPCVGGDLLGQRAPGLVPHSHCFQRLAQSSNGLALEQSGYVRGLSPAHVASCFGRIDSYLTAAAASGQVLDVIGAQELSLLLEVSELYCHVSPSSVYAPVQYSAWPILSAVSTCPKDALASFTTTCGEVLISIAEYLVQDVLLVMAAAGNATAAPRLTATAAASSSSSRGSSSVEKPRYGGDNPSVTLEHRLAWARDVVSTLAMVLQLQSPAGSPQGPRGSSSGAALGLLTASSTLRISRLLETTLRTPGLLSVEQAEIMSLLPHALPALYTAASSTEGSAALLSAITSAAKRQQVMNAALTALAHAVRHLGSAAAGVMAAVPGYMGRVLAAQMAQETDDAASFVHQTCSTGLHLASLAEGLLARAAALLDPEVAPAAACLARKVLAVLPGQEGKAWGVEALMSDPEYSGLDYWGLLSTDPQQLAGVTKELEAALIQQHAASARKQAARLAQAAGSGQAADTARLAQQLQGVWLGRDVQGGPDARRHRSQETAGGGSAEEGFPAKPPAAAAAALGPGELPLLVQALCDAGALQREDVLEAGGPAAMGPATPEDLRVAATALLIACKAAAALAQLPQLLEQVERVMKEQPWGQGLASMDLPRLHSICNGAAGWVLLLAPVLGLLVPAEQAVQLQQVAAGALRDSEDTPVLTPDVTSRVLGLLGHVVAPGAPGCSYPGCCNLEGRSEAELPVQACSKCKGVRYCCREHQVAHWKAGHKEVCRATQAVVKHMCDVAAGRSDQVKSVVSG